MIDSNESQFVVHDLIQSYVMALNAYFPEVREKEIINNFNQCNYILNEFICAGMIVTTDSQSALQRFREKNKIEISELSTKETVHKAGQIWENIWGTIKNRTVG